MRKILVLLIACCVSVSLQNCSNEFELTEKWKDITVVYGLLDGSDTAQYILIEKAFLDESTSALLIAQNPDSLFYNNIIVEMQEIPVSGGSGSFFCIGWSRCQFGRLSKRRRVYSLIRPTVYKLKKTS